MIEIGGMPIIWHIMKIYSSHGINDFVVCLGYKGYLIKEYFANYFLHTSDVTFDLQNNSMEVHHGYQEAWKVTLVDTGESSMTGGRLARVRPYVKDEEDFCLTYGDGVGDVNITESIQFHREKGLKATVTAAFPPGRFGALDIDGEHIVRAFHEKPAGDGGLINAGFFVLKPSVLDLIPGDDSVWEEEPLETLAKSGELAAFKHLGFWQPMDTLRDKNHLEQLWDSGQAPWKSW
jgi:glucose-1-phosphate cytidylyltransferase